MFEKARAESSYNSYVKFLRMLEHGINLSQQHEVEIVIAAQRFV